MKAVNEHVHVGLNEITIGYSNPQLYDNRIQLLSSSDADKYLRKIWTADTIEVIEQVKIVYLNNASQVLGHLNMATGTINACIIDIRYAVAVALKCNAHAIIACHNHPSGRLIPSKLDAEMTQELKAGLALFKLALHDHIIISTESYYSFADNGQI